MIVVRRDIVEEYLRQAAGSKGIAATRRAYQAWFAVASASQWRTPMHVKRSHPKVSVLKGGRIVFNIKGNDYRLVAQVNYQAGTVEIRIFGTHAEYDNIDAEMI
ncbi:MAG: type II toxin-antitoxin system HigB family toxin [Gammaproteobacteria bacterium]|nr:type II toxin-antitoxin system HigB family toxin [Gammaproteobacteria bacterium]